MATPIPIIVCGATQAVAVQVKSNMLPEFDVVYAGFDLPATLTEVPQILSNRTSPPPSSTLHTQLGSNDFTTNGFPRAVVAGGGYTDEAFNKLFQACVQACGGGGSDEDAKLLPVPFFRVDNGITSRLVAEGKMPATGTPEYPAAIAGRLKERLREVGVVEGEGERRNGGSVFMF
ncbi:Programmed cell death 6-interacting protein isoform x1 [Lasiodiplodia theobromae]|uniref:Programmed cell death 6-interacting protein isoform x1 n=1 Tax=Lasiodiplodia theobromae TaxID=45133 RepID=UPI0015C3BBCC|nr:Programmed cell death 6-interacting protein isoform x1 [Lasiodiplodia theobromae]KAF4544361.1 Programmed cell death 6-interacting protein isoform x1 [Lasiodiplodia theobromae]